MHLLPRLVDAPLLNRRFRVPENAVSFPIAIFNSLKLVSQKVDTNRPLQLQKRRQPFIRARFCAGLGDQTHREFVYRRLQFDERSQHSSARTMKRFP